LDNIFCVNVNQTGKNQQIQSGEDSNLPSWLELVREQVVSLKFGTVQITVHDSRVTQVERLEKLRLDRPK
jgi:hypothetical protein